MLLSIIITEKFSPESNILCEPNWSLFIIGFNVCYSLEAQIFTGMVNGAFLIYSIYLVRKWSVQWNKKY